MYTAIDSPFKHTNIAFLHLTNSVIYMCPFLSSSCKEVEVSSPGCTPVSHLPLTNVQVDIDSDREIEKIHALLLQNMDKLENMQGTFRVV